MSSSSWRGSDTLGLLGTGRVGSQLPSSGGGFGNGGRCPSAPRKTRRNRSKCESWSAGAGPSPCTPMKRMAPRASPGSAIRSTRTCPAGWESCGRRSSRLGLLDAGRFRDGIHRRADASVRVRGPAGRRRREGTNLIASQGASPVAPGPICSCRANTSPSIRVDDADAVDHRARLPAGDASTISWMSLGVPGGFGDDVFGERRPGQRLQLRREGVQVVVARRESSRSKVGLKAQEDEKILDGHEMTHLLARNSA